MFVAVIFEMNLFLPTPFGANPEDQKNTELRKD